MEILELEQAGMAELPIPFADVAPVWGPGEYGEAVMLTTNDSAPSDMPSTTLTLYDKGSMDYMYEQALKAAVFPIQRQFNPRGTSRANLTIWKAIDHLGRCRVPSKTLGAGPGLPFSGEALTSPATVKGEYVLRLIWGVLASLTSGEAQNLLDIESLSELSTVPGYPGPDRIMYAIAAAAGGATANVIVSTNGGGAWATLGTDPLAADENPKHIAIRFINSTQFRVIILRGTTDAGNPPEIVYNDFTLGAESTISAWTSVNINATNNQAGEAMKWLFPERLYAAAAGDIYVSTNFGVSFSAVLYTGATVINGFVKAADNSVYAFGASNLLLRETGKSGSFAAVTGPTGSNASTAMAICGVEEDMTLILGNGNSIFSCKKPSPTAVADWTSLKNFGSNKAVMAILPARNLQARLGDPDCFYVLVDDTAGSTAALWFTRDGGQTWRQATSLTNTGYNAARLSRFDPNKIWVVGDGGVAQLYQPEAA